MGETTAVRVRATMSKMCSLGYEFGLSHKGYPSFASDQSCRHGCEDAQKPFSVNKEWYGVAFGSFAVWSVWCRYWCRKLGR